MGLLKHFVLPFFAVLDLAQFYQMFVAEDLADMLEMWGRDVNEVPVTILELHFAHALGAVFLAFFFNCVAGIFIENSHYRGMVVFSQTLVLALDGYSYVRLGVTIPAVLYGVVGTGVVGLVVHSMEPGIFTKDKDKTKSG